MRSIGSHDEPVTTIVLIRHGEPVVATTGVVGGPIGDVGLTPEGRAQAVLLAERLTTSGELRHATTLYASSLPRAKETAALLAPALGLDVVVRHDLREHDPGELDGLTWREAKDRFELPDFDTHPDVPLAPGAESLGGFHERVRGALDELAALHRGETTVVACHGGVVAAAVGMAFGLAVTARVLLPTKYLSMTDLELSDRGWRLGRYNDRYPVTDPVR
jgi:2,3-bisphosphoglycerate-dependent phosphoglycerate mutase